MNTLRNRRSSYETSFSSNVSRGNSDNFLPKSNSDTRRTNTYEAPRRTLSFREYTPIPTPTRTGSKSNFSDSLSNLNKGATKESLLGKYGRIAPTVRDKTIVPRQRRSSSSDFLIRTQHGTDSGRATSLESLQSTLARLQSSLSSKSHKSASSSTNDSLSNFTAAKNRSLSSRRTSYHTSKESSLSSACPSDVRSTSLSSFGSTVSDRLSTPRASISTRKTHDSFMRTLSTTSLSGLATPKGNGLCGIRNKGNSCYQNAVLQMLNAIPEFVNFLLDTNKVEARSGKLASEMVRMCREFWKANEESTIDTMSLRSCLYHLDKKWMSHNQEDAHEFFTQIISALQEDFNRNLTKPRYMELEDQENVRLQAMMEWKYCKQWNDSEIDDIFGFQLHNQMICPKCGNESNRFEYLTSLEVSLSNKCTTIEDCLCEFMKAERLDKDNEWYCTKCKMHVQAAKQLRISRYPKILIICLKRFSSSSSHSSFFRSWKNKTNISLPQGCVNLSSIRSPTVDSSIMLKTEYDLIGIVDHSGSVDFGHYTARVKNAQNQDWYLMNDENVRKISKPIGPSESPYLLALRQIDTN